MRVIKTTGFTKGGFLVTKFRINRRSKRFPYTADIENASKIYGAINFDKDGKVMNRGRADCDIDISLFVEPIPI